METAVTCDEANPVIGTGTLRTDCGAHAVTHSTHTARCEERSAFHNLAELCNPHLVLTYICCDDV